MTDFYTRMINIPIVGDKRTSEDNFALGHKEARHDAAEIALEADAEIERLTAQIEALVEALMECRDEIDSYISQKYPHDHPVQERYRQHNYMSNPARIALAAKETP